MHGFKETCKHLKILSLINRLMRQMMSGSMLTKRREMDTSEQREWVGISQMAILRASPMLVQAYQRVVVVSVLHMEHNLVAAQMNNIMIVSGTPQDQKL